MEARRAGVEITYNGAAVTAQLMGQYGEFTYTDPASGEADSVDIALNDRDRQWITAWLPTKGDTLTAAIETQNWDKEGERRSLQCGFFILDDYNFTGWPMTGTLSGVSVPADTSFRDTERTRNWENITIQEIGKEIAKRAGIELVWDVDGEPITVKSVEQSKKADCDFYAELCAAYGLATKVYARKIVVYDREAYKAKDTVAKVTITEKIMETMSWHSSLAGTYTGGEYTYTDPTTEEEIKVSVGTGTRILKKNGKADSLADAERKIKAEVANANHSATTMSVTIPGMIDIVASSCVTVVGVGRLSGKYFVDKVTSHVSASGGYTMDLELSLVDNMTEEVIKDAIQRLVAVGVINTPAYWEQHYKDVLYLDGLILNMATMIKVNAGGSSITTVDAALQVLTDTGVINSPDYWAEKHSALTYLDTLIIKAANALTK